jgi:hypothetical protein
MATLSSGRFDMPKRKPVWEFNGEHFVRGEEVATAKEILKCLTSYHARRPPKDASKESHRKECTVKSCTRSSCRSASTVPSQVIVSALEALFEFYNRDVMMQGLCPESDGRKECNQKSDHGACRHTRARQILREAGFLI